MRAGVSAAANVIVADGEVAHEEFEIALAGHARRPDRGQGLRPPDAGGGAYEAVGLAPNRAGCAENLRRVAAVAVRPAEQREGVFLVAADVADHDGIAAVEDGALHEIATALVVDKARLLRAVAVRPTPGRSAA